MTPILPQYIPPRQPEDTHRTLILLFDGTGDKEDADVTNVVHFRNCLYGWGQDTTNTDKQLVYYQQGIGTFYPIYRGKEIVIPFVGPTSRTVDQAIAWSLPDHVTHAYRWLAKYYKPGDKISLFGFSRGAYTARALGGMLNCIHLLPDDKIDKADEAYQLFARELPKEQIRDDPITKEALDKLFADFATFKDTNNCTKVDIDFIGCWDTVNSVGIVRPVKLKFTANNNIVRVFRHALALDEHRVRFKPNLWGRPKPKDGVVMTDVEEVWFAGCHCDVGGGSVPNHTRPSLPYIPLRWMIRECFKTNTGIMFRSDDLNFLGINPSHLYPKVLPRPAPLPPPDQPTIPPPTKPTFIQSLTARIPFISKPKPLIIPHFEITEEEHDLQDCLAPSYDQLELNPTIWKSMEYYPMITDVYQKDAVYPQLLFKEERVAHKGSGRTIPSGSSSHGNKIKIHRSVKIRMQGTIMQDGKKYVPRGNVGYEKKDFATADTTEFEWVD